MNAIRIPQDKTMPLYIDQDECVECGVCLRASICPVDAIYQQDLEWPRAIRQAFSAVVVGYDAFEKAGIYGFKRTSSGGGRGTAEMKTNDVTGRYGERDVGVGVEFGRPGVGFRFRELEKMSKALRKVGVRFEPENPVSILLDPETGEIRFPEIKNEKVLSAILETKIDRDKILEVLNTIKKISMQLDTVISIDMINKCHENEIPIKSIIEDAGFQVRINGKTNIGLGRPLIK
jgi:ferredoxin